MTARERAKRTLPCADRFACRPEKPYGGLGKHLEPSCPAAYREGVEREILAAEQVAVKAAAADAARRALELYARIARPKPHNIDRGVVQTIVSDAVRDTVEAWLRSRGEG